MFSNLFARLFRRSQPQPRPVIIVSGLPRSGTSMMMKMLKAGGIELLTDEQRLADEDNPQGYFEFERVKKLKEGDVDWVPAAQGKAVKVISYLMEGLPADQRYQVIFMQRDMQEILASQKQMLIRRGEPTDRVSDEEMATLFKKHLKQVEAWLEEQPNIEVLYVHYTEILNDPRTLASTVAGFLGVPLDVEQMAAVPDERLHRQRSRA